MQARLGPKQINRVLEDVAAFGKQVIAQQHFPLWAKGCEFFDDVEGLFSASENVLDCCTAHEIAFFLFKSVKRELIFYITFWDDLKAAPGYVLSYNYLEILQN